MSCETQIREVAALMKNLTVSIDEEAYKQARVVAAKRGTPVSRLVRDFLSRIDQVDDQTATEWSAPWQEIDSDQARIGEHPSRAGTYTDVRIR